MICVITVHGLTYLFLGLLILVLLLIILVLLYGYRNYQLIQNRQFWENLIENKISLAILEGVETIRNDQEINQLLDIEDFQRLFLSILIASDQKFSGDAHHVLVQIFYEYKMDTLAWKKMKSRDIYKNIRAIQAFTAMHVEDAIPEIISFLTHKDARIRSESQYAMVRFKDFRGLDFLNSFDGVISDWQKIRLLKSISEVPHQYYSTISNWLKHPNSSVVVFTLQLLKKFRISYFYNEIISLLNHIEVNIKIYAIQTLQSIEDESTISELIHYYPTQCNHVQVEIISFIRKSKSYDSVSFLKEELMNARSINVRVSVAETLVSLGQASYLKNILEMPTIPEPILQVVKHALAVKL